MFYARGGFFFLKEPPFRVLPKKTDGFAVNNTRSKEGAIAMKRLITVLLLFLLPICALADASLGINQPMEKSEEWVQLVESSPFQLGETEEKNYGSVTYRETAYGAYPSLDGSTVSVPMAREFARQHLNLHEAELDAFVRFSTTHDAYVNLIEKKPNLGAELPFTGSVMEERRPVDIFIGTEPSEEELALAEAQGVKLVVTPVCYDAFVFIVNKVNPVESLTVKQIQDIYTDQVRTWEDLDIAFENSVGDPYDIYAYTRQRNSGSQTAMENLVMKGLPITQAHMNFYQVFEMSGLVQNIGGYSNEGNAIGYTYKFYIDTLYKDEGIKAIAIDGIEPTEENIRSGKYPFSTCYYAVTREGENERFVEWMLSDEGQACIKQAGYIPYNGG